MVNDIRADMGKPAVFEVHLVGLEKEVPQSTGLFSASRGCLLEEVEETGLIMVSAINDDSRESYERHQEFQPCIIEQYRKGAAVASVCVGAFYLTETGLLDGKYCATHSMHADTFRQMYPQVNLVDEKIMTEEDGIYTSGGTYAFTDLLLHLIEKYAGREEAIMASKAVSLDISRDNQSDFIIFKGQKDHKDDKVRKAQQFIETHYQEKIQVDRLAEQLAMSRRTLERRFKKATRNTVTQ